MMIDLTQARKDINDDTAGGDVLYDVADYCIDEIAMLYSTIDLAINMLSEDSDARHILEQGLK